jgi:hypothetical protein
MAQKNCLVDGTLEEAAEALAGRAAALRAGAEKRAAGGDFLASLGDRVRDNPALLHALVGGGAGAVVGGSAAALGNRGRPEDERHSVLGSALTGGLAGAALGGGASAAHRLLTGGGPQGLAHGDAMRPGQFVDPRTGSRMQIDPEALRQNPGLAARARDLATPPPWYEDLPVRGLGFASDALTGNWFGRMMLGAGTADAALHSDRLRLGDRNWLNAPAAAADAVGHGVNKAIAGVNRLRPGTMNPITPTRVGDLWRRGVTGGAGGRERFFGLGMIDPRNSRNVEHLSRGLEEMGGNPERHQLTPEQAEAIRGLRNTDAGRSRVEALARERGPRTHNASIDLGREIADPPELRTVTERQQLVDPNTGRPVGAYNAQGHPIDTVRETSREQYINQPVRRVPNPQDGDAGRRRLPQRDGAGRPRPRRGADQEPVPGPGRRGPHPRAARPPGGPGAGDGPVEPVPRAPAARRPTWACRWPTTPSSSTARSRPARTSCGSSWPNTPGRSPARRRKEADPMAMVKTVSPSGWDWNAPAASLVKVAHGGLRGEDRRAFIKRAAGAENVFLPFLDSRQVRRRRGAGPPDRPRRVRGVRPEPQRRRVQGGVPARRTTTRSRSTPSSTATTRTRTR